ncbi:MAG: RagB/SusD family nutrient uptake outer membrane protein, partial [Chitinophagaceae bacterium]|nr:RagB/SusD family nutrient uptake outer membrane protein [Chitinophagaceae bacterium]
CLLTVVVSMGSCKKFLEGRSQSEMTPETTLDYSELFFNEGYSKIDFFFQPAVMYMDDDIQCYSYPTAFDQPTAAEFPLAAFTWQPNYLQLLTGMGYVTEEGGNTYKKYYKCIAGCNIALDAVDKTIGTQEEKDQLKGEALVLRAFYYFNLANLYGNPYNDSTTTPEKQLAVPLILTSNLSDKMPVRNTVAEVYAQIGKDLLQGIALLEKKKKMSSYRMNYLAARLLASRVGLFTEKWDDVISSASIVINDHPQILDLNDWPDDYYPDAETFKPICSKPNIDALWLFSDELDYYDNRTAIVYGISEDLASKYEPTDIRSWIYISEIPDFIRMYAPIKFAPYKRLGNSDRNFSGSAFRATEAYLNRAEAYAQLYIKTGDHTMGQKALDDLNAVRIKRFKPADYQPVALMPATELLQFCRDERRREFCTEGHRWYDLKRYGMPSITHIYSRKGVTDKLYRLEARDPQYNLQIPPVSMQMNYNLVQNPAGPERKPIN